jgi:hypothetical protein
LETELGLLPNGFMTSDVCWDPRMYGTMIETEISFEDYGERQDRTVETDSPTKHLKEHLSPFGGETASNYLGDPGDKMEHENHSKNYITLLDEDGDPIVERRTIDHKGFNGRSFLKDAEEDVQCFRARMIQAIVDKEEGQKKESEHVSYICEVQDSKGDEMLTSNTEEEIPPEMPTLMGLPMPMPTEVLTQIITPEEQEEAPPDMPMPTVISMPKPTWLAMLTPTPTWLLMQTPTGSIMSTLTGVLPMRIIPPPIGIPIRIITPEAQEAVPPDMPMPTELPIRIIALDAEEEIPPDIIPNPKGLTMSMPTGLPMRTIPPNMPTPTDLPMHSHPPEIPTPKRLSMHTMCHKWFHADFLTEPLYAPQFE